MHVANNETSLIFSASVLDEPIMITKPHPFIFNFVLWTLRILEASTSASLKFSECQHFFYIIKSKLSPDKGIFKPGYVHKRFHTLSSFPGCETFPYTASNPYYTNRSYRVWGQCCFGDWKNSRWHGRKMQCQDWTARWYEGRPLFCGSRCTDGKNKLAKK